MKRHAKALVVVVVVGATALTVSAVAAFARPSRATATTIRVKGGEFFFKPSAPSARHGKITFVFKNVGHVAHDLKVAGKRTPIIQPGKSARLVLELKPGRYPFECTVPGHAQAGMRGVLKVR